MRTNAAEQEWFLTAPFDPVMVRRGDPLGFRQITDWYADLLAPGLSNRTYDVRWLTILSWILHRANHVWQHFRDGATLDSAEATRRYYEWIKPLELLWVARTEVELLRREVTTVGYQLPGIRAIARWRESDRKLPSFGLGLDQYRRYRQTGVYGAYRVMLRQVGCLTRERDGFRPERKLQELIDLVDGDVPRVHPPKLRRGKVPDPARYWVHDGWPSWHGVHSSQLFPTLRASAGRLTAIERNVLCPQIFGHSAMDPDARRRRRVAEILAKSHAPSHTLLCGVIARHLDADRFQDQLLLLPIFSAVADAGVDTMDAIWRELSEEPQRTVKQVATRVASSLEQLLTASTSWRKSLKPHIAGQGVVHSLANGICHARSDQERVVALVNHHERFGGGLSWFKFSGNGTQLVRFAPVRPTGTARYRFRLYALCRMALQCGVIDQIPSALDYSPGEEE